MTVLVDYDNLAKALRKPGGLPDLCNKVIGCISNTGGVLNHRIRFRLYGGWYDGNYFTRQAQRLTTEVQSAFPSTIRWSNENASGNRLRFPLFYFDAFMELVKLGVLVPAFDGFEEMFVQNASGDALSAVGNLMRTLDSSGSVLIAARKAYFEYQDIKTQAKLFDSIGGCSVVFSRVSLRRWGQKEFVTYASLRLIENPEDIYSRVSNRLGANHPLLTRAVLVKRLLDVADSVSSLSELLQQIGSSPNDYFAVFVRAIIEREATEKWIDTSGEAAKPLLSTADHFDLLALIAQEMWSLSTEYLKADVLDLLTELFCESRRLPPAVAFQIRTSNC